MVTLYLVNVTKTWKVIVSSEELFFFKGAFPCFLFSILCYDSFNMLLSMERAVKVDRGMLSMHSNRVNGERESSEKKRDEGKQRERGGKKYEMMFGLREQREHKFRESTGALASLPCVVYPPAVTAPSPRPDHTQTHTLKHSQTTNFTRPI